MSHEDLKKKLREIARGNFVRDVRERSKYSKSICEHIAGSEPFKKASHVAIFAPREFEPDLLDLWSKAPERVVFPKVSGNELAFYPIKSPEDLKPGYSSILEPPSGLPTLFQAQDLILVPGLSFDRNGGRLGSGKGFYDRFLSGIQSQKWGVIFENQLAKEPLAQSSNDVRMDGLVTEKGLTVW